MRLNATSMAAPCNQDANKKVATTRSSSVVIEKGSWAMRMQKLDYKITDFLTFAFDCPNPPLLHIKAGYSIIVFQWKYTMLWSYWSTVISEFNSSTYNIWFLFQLREKIC